MAWITTFCVGLTILIYFCTCDTQVKPTATIFINDTLSENDKYVRVERSVHEKRCGSGYSFIELYENINHNAPRSNRGERLNICVPHDGCKTLPREWHDRTGSLRTLLDCIIIYDLEECKGYSAQNTYCEQSSSDIYHLDNCRKENGRGFNNQIRSISGCLYSQPTITTTQMSTTPTSPSLSLVDLPVKSMCTNNFCRLKGDGLHTDSKACSRYYCECGSGFAHLKWCNPNEWGERVYDANTNNCNYHSQTKACNPTVPTTTTITITTTASSISTTTEMLSYHETILKTSCTNSLCQQNANTFYGMKDACSRLYCSCQSYIAYLFECPNDSAFDMSIGSCNYRTNIVHCSLNILPTASTSTSTETRESDDDEILIEDFCNFVSSKYLQNVHFAYSICGYFKEFLSVRFTKSNVPLFEYLRDDFLQFTCLKMSCSPMSEAWYFLTNIFSIFLNIKFPTRSINQLQPPTSPSLPTTTSKSTSRASTTTTETATTTTENACRIGLNKSVTKLMDISKFSFVSRNRTKRYAPSLLMANDFESIMNMYDEDVEIPKVSKTGSTQSKDRRDPVDTYYYTQIGNNIIPLGVSATITGRNSAGRTDFGTKFNDQMEFLDAYGFGETFKDYRPKDEKGHLVASRSDGVASVFNMVPQSPLLNKNYQMYSDGGWFQQETNIANWVTGDINECRGVEFRVAINYEFSRSKRPVGFKVEIDYYNDIVSRQFSHDYEQYYSNQFRCYLDDL